MDVTPESVCLGKIAHATKQDAAADIGKKRAQFGGRWHAYRCPFCWAHHVGHVARVQGNGIGGKSARNTRRRDRVYA